LGNCETLEFHYIFSASFADRAAELGSENVLIPALVFFSGFFCCVRPGEWMMVYEDF
jgi:hypothetical protein